jgi:hypothetical protein
MEVHFTLEQEIQLAELAIQAGTDTEQLVKEIVLRLLADKTKFSIVAAELPLWHLGTVGPFHRRDIYSDVP